MMLCPLSSAHFCQARATFHSRKRIALWKQSANIYREIIVPSKINVDGSFQNVPKHPRFSCPDTQSSFRRELLCQHPSSAAWQSAVRPRRPMEMFCGHVTAAARAILGLAHPRASTSLHARFLCFWE